MDVVLYDLLHMNGMSTAQILNVSRQHTLAHALMHGGMESRRMLTCMMANMLIAH